MTEVLISVTILGVSRFLCRSFKPTMRFQLLRSVNSWMLDFRWLKPLLEVLLRLTILGVPRHIWQGFMPTMSLQLRGAF
ncbi:hypothetical protein Mapa_005030 [Marchantia paleacea]|nr:hypothetical protein Mapa_005030 [Marchantia paleacea]